MADLTNQQVLEGISELISGLTDIMATKKDLDGFATKKDLERFATRHDLVQMEARLTRKLDSHKKASIQHHLTTRADIGELNRKFDGLRAGLAQAAKSI